MDRELWFKALKIYDKHLKQTGKRISRLRLAELLGVNEQIARNILFAIENRDIISGNPYVFEIDKKQVELILADVHIPYQDDLALQTVFAYLEDNKIQPGIIVLLGDIVDFYQISKFSRDPSRKNIKQELFELRSFLERLRNQFPDAKIYYKEGNHCSRANKYIFDNAREIANLLEDFFIEKAGLIEYNIEYMIEPFRIGKLWHLHGHERGRGSYNVEYITNVIWKYVHDNFVVGHFHRTQDKIFKSIDGKFYIGCAVGCLCQLRMDYAILNNWNHGFAVVYYDDKGNFILENKKIIEGGVF